MNASKEQILTALKMLEAIRDAIYETGDRGLPASMIFVSLSEHGCTYQAFENMMGILLQGGCVRLSNHVYYKARVQ